ncbi:hypothetical protein pipiens_019628 [Culex pipiens pipiens]|uniref:Uncharacterized protein n=1 Tax=Culex pipiens pipiens TaxID=38569 RepID=A0ABD1DST8_CULPP
MEHEVVDKARKVKKVGNIYIPGEPKVAFVMRICGIIIKLNKFVKHRHNRIPTTDFFVIERKLRAAYKPQHIDR